jgi:adenylosuccinate synthase
VAKAYTTRVGSGPFPTELDDAVGEEIRRKGNEFGTTTGRARRTGWMDLVALRYAARINGLTALAITKLDVLSGFDRVLVCTRYKGRDEAEFEHFPYHQSVLHHATTSHYEEFEGWTEDLGECTSAADLPRTTREYLDYIADQTGVPVVLVGVGPRRDQVIWLQDDAAPAAAAA